MNADVKVATGFVSMGTEEVQLQKWESETSKWGQVIKQLLGCWANTNAIDSPQVSSVKGKATSFSAVMMGDGHPAVIQGLSSSALPMPWFKRGSSKCLWLPVFSLLQGSCPRY